MNDAHHDVQRYLIFTTRKGDTTNDKQTTTNDVPGASANPHINADPTREHETRERERERERE